jgi:aromatic ring-opening dioxygenase catalytic subunit (LigB family)
MSSTNQQSAAERMPAIFIPHGGGPCFFMDWDPPHTWDNLRAWFEQLPQQIGRAPKAILLVSGHWETKGFTVTGAERPGLIYDYSGFPEHTYRLTYPAPGAPVLAKRVHELLSEAGLPARVDPQRGWDHGVFVPLKVVFPEAQIPVVELSVDLSLLPELHLKAGQALAKLRDEGVLILGSGMSYHNMRGLFGKGNVVLSNQFDQWLTDAMTADAETRARQLTRWADAPGAREAHPREEHLIPLMVVAGAGEEKGQKLFEDRPMGGHLVSAFGVE